MSHQGLTGVQQLQEDSYSPPFKISAYRVLNESHNRHMSTCLVSSPVIALALDIARIHLPRSDPEMIGYLPETLLHTTAFIEIYRLSHRLSVVHPVTLLLKG